jgi:hypothetical protein
MKARRMRWAEHVAEKRNAYMVVGGKGRGKEATRKTKT